MNVRTIAERTNSYERLSEHLTGYVIGWAGHPREYAIRIFEGWADMAGRPTAEVAR